MVAEIVGMDDLVDAGSPEGGNSTRNRIRSILLLISVPLVRHSPMGKHRISVCLPFVDNWVNILDAFLMVTCQSSVELLLGIAASFLCDIKDTPLMQAGLTSQSAAGS